MEGIFVQSERKFRTIGSAVILALLLSSCGRTPAIPEPAVLPVTEGAETEEAASSEEKEPLVSESVTEPDEIVSAAAENDPVSTVTVGRYAYRTLSSEGQTVYDEILECVLNQETKIEVSTLDKDLLDIVYEAVNADYGGLFWMNGYVYTTYTLGGQAMRLEFAPKYTMDYEERVETQRLIDEAVGELLSGISHTASDYEKAKYVFETLIREVDYDLDAPENQNIVSALLYHRTVCQGYACATQYLMHQLGIESFIVTGLANGENHAWNIVKLDGDYYYLDTTWGNSQYSAADELPGKFVNYAYLNTTTDEIMRTHVSDTPFELPSCTATADNYFVKEGLYFNTWEPDAVGELISTAWFSGPLPISVKFSDAELFARSIDYFVTEQHIADFCPGLTGYSYLNDTSLNVLTISF